MKACKKAEQSIKDKTAGVVILSAIDRFLCNDLSFESVKKESWEIAKYLIKNDKETKKELAIVIGCKLRKYL